MVEENQGEIGGPVESVADTASIPEGEAPAAIPESIAAPESIPEPEALQTPVVQNQQTTWIQAVQALAPLAAAAMRSEPDVLSQLAKEMLVQDLIDLRRSRRRNYSFSASEEEFAKGLSE